MSLGASTRPLRICIDARLHSGKHGGIETVVIGLASSLTGLDDGNEEYTFLAYEGEDAWLTPFVGKSARVLRVAPPQRKWKHRLLEYSQKGNPLLKALLRLVRRFRRRGFELPQPPVEFRSEEFDVVHFPIQAAFVTDVPSIYHPHDLQHLHLPQFFSAEEYRLRESLYRGFSAQARYVAVTSSWVRDDLIRNYGLDPSRVIVVSWPSILSAYRSPSVEELSAIESRFELPDRFLLYPAQTWSHKNHLRLLEAIARLRDERNITVALVCCGHLTDFYHRMIVPMIREVGLEQQVRFLGFVSPEVLSGLYALCRGVIVPTTFEAASGPVSEAMSLGLPIACSNVTALPAQVRDGALLFAPDDVQGIMDAAATLWMDDALCANLGRRARAIAEELSWPTTAKTFRALYRQMAGRQLNEQDRLLLATPPKM